MNIDRSTRKRVGDERHNVAAFNIIVGQSLVGFAYARTHDTQFVDGGILLGEKIVNRCPGGVNRREVENELAVAADGMPQIVHQGGKRRVGIGHPEFHRLVLVNNVEEKFLITFGHRY